MGLLVNCPQGAAIADVGIARCPESVGQIQKAVIQRLYSTGAVKNKFVVATANPNVLASWSPLLAAADGTKAVQTPYIQAPTTEPGAAREFGGGNETLGGIPIIIGREPTSFTGNLLFTSQATIAELKKYQTEGNVGAYLADEFGRVIALADDVDTPTEIFPIPIAALFVGDKAFGGIEGADMNSIAWKFPPNWSDKLVIITPTDFNALTDLVTP
tara:strand:+ start:5079 stop:5723 length:645 start_codon:yes stop_codon:yes gene_type:complete